MSLEQCGGKPSYRVVSQFPQSNLRRLKGTEEGRGCDSKEKFEAFPMLTDIEDENIYPVT